MQAAFDEEEPRYFEEAQATHEGVRRYLADLPDGPHAQAAVALLMAFGSSMEDAELRDLARRVRYGNAGTDRRGQRLADQERLACTGVERGVADGAPLHSGDAGRNTDHDLGTNQREAATTLVDEVAQHLLGHDVIGDHAVAHRTHDLDRLARFSAEHISRFDPDRLPRSPWRI